MLVVEIHLSDDEEARLQRQADANGTDIETLVAAHLQTLVDTAAELAAPGETPPLLP